MPEAQASAGRRMRVLVFHDGLSTEDSFPSWRERRQSRFMDYGILADFSYNGFLPTHHTPPFDEYSQLSFSVWNQQPIICFAKNELLSISSCSAHTYVNSLPGRMDSFLRNKSPTQSITSRDGFLPAPKYKQS